jgi:hypothetical protein
MRSALQALVEDLLRRRRLLLSKSPPSATDRGKASGLREAAEDLKALLREMETHEPQESARPATDLVTEEEEHGRCDGSLSAGGGAE